LHSDLSQYELKSGPIKCFDQLMPLLTAQQFVISEQPGTAMTEAGYE